MGKQMTPNLRGKGYSSKLTKDGKPKHAGNWSAITIHYQSMQFQDYAVKRIDGILVVGNETKLSDIFPEELVRIIDADPNFESLSQVGTHTHNGKQYEARRSLRRVIRYCAYSEREYIYREEIYTDGDFKYNFKEY